MASPQRFSLVIPVFNEAEAIADTIRDVRGALAEMGAYELIFVDDGSTDGSGESLKASQVDDPDILVVSHDSNRGYGAAIKSGITRATAEWIAITDADGSYPVRALPELLARAESTRASMVIGARTGQRVSYPLLRRLPKLILRWYVSWVTRRPVPDFNSGLRVFRKDAALEFIKILPNGFSLTTTLTVAMLTNYRAVDFVPIDYAPRIGKSKIRPIRDTVQILQLMVRTGMYFAPLRVFFPVVVVLAAAFAGSLAYDVLALRNLTDKTVLLLMFTMNTVLFALLADMVDKRSGR